MPTVQIGRSEIAYELRRSARATERRITVTPGNVEVLALCSDSDDDISDFLNRKRQWLFNTVREISRLTASRHAVPRFASGSKILYRGRRMPLTVRRSDSERIEIAFSNGFVIDLPDWARSDTDRLVASELKLWLKQRARRDTSEVASAYGRFGLTPRSIRVGDFAHGWGSCGPEGNILINWHLIFAPKKVLEYVVVHELSHLRHRSHNAAFWKQVEAMMPNYEEARHWLSSNEGSLSADFLNV